jgi:hypothetical protein
MMSQAPPDDHAPIRADRLAGQIIIATCDRRHASAVIICNYKTFTPESGNVSLFVARKNWLKSWQSPPSFNANPVNIEEPHRGLLGYDLCQLRPSTNSEKLTEDGYQS